METCILEHQCNCSCGVQFFVTVLWLACGYQDVYIFPVELLHYVGWIQAGDIHSMPKCFRSGPINHIVARTCSIDGSWFSIADSLRKILVEFHMPVAVFPRHDMYSTFASAMTDDTDNSHMYRLWMAASAIRVARNDEMWSSGKMMETVYFLCQYLGMAAVDIP